MAEPGLTSGAFANVLVQRAEDIGWVLCIGAGTSLGALPDWNALVETLITNHAVLRTNKAALKRLWKSLTPEALVQASKNQLGLTDEIFAETLADSLYQRLRAKLDAPSWSICAQALSAVSPGELLTRKKWDSYLAIAKRELRGASALAIAEVIYAALKKDRLRARTSSSPSIGPSAILSFNAEPLLFSLVNAYAATDTRSKSSLSSRRLLDRVNRGISYRSPDRIPYIFCHGLLPIPDALPRYGRILSAEKLVFSEGEYLAMANTSFSWASSMFLSHAVLRTMVFIGLSFTDQNLRRWLAWVQENKRAELEHQARIKGLASPLPTPYGHYWINRRPKTRREETWIESSVEHLGVRLVWINNWSEIGPCLAGSLGL